MAPGDSSGAPSSGHAGDEGPGKCPTPLAGGGMGWLQYMSLRSRANEPESKPKGRNNPQRNSQQQQQQPPAPATGQTSRPRTGGLSRHGWSGDSEVPGATPLLLAFLRGRAASVNAAQG